MCFLNGMLIVLGVLAALFCIEAGLTLSSNIFLSRQRFKYNAISRKYFDSNKTEGSFKILCLGDSSTYGSGVAIPYSYPFQLSKLLNRRSPSFEVTVISTGGTNTSQFANRYDNFLGTDNYDLVIFQAGINDVNRLAECNAPIYTNYGQLRRITDSRLFNLVRFFLGYKKAVSAGIDCLHAKNYGIGTRFFLDEGSLKLFHYNLNKIANISKRHNVTLWLQDYHADGWMHPEKVLYEVYDELGLHVIHQKKIFDYAQGIRMTGRDGWHPNCYGYFVIARLIYNNMIEHGMAQGKKYNLYSEIDKIRGYIKNKGEGYQYIADNGSKFNEKEFIRVLKRIGIDIDKSDSGVGKFRISGVFDFDKNSETGRGF